MNNNNLLLLALIEWKPQLAIEYIPLLAIEWYKPELTPNKKRTRPNECNTNTANIE